MVIGAVTIVTAVVGNQLLTDEDTRWFRHLQRPRWLTFEKAIPAIWTIIFICGARSAVLVWNAAPGTPRVWGLMGLYFLLELLTIAYTPGMCKTKSLRVGTAIGAAGAVTSVILALLVFPVSRPAVGLLLPYILWSPVGTYTTQAMIPLNPGDR